MPKNVARGTLLGIAGQVWHLLTVFLLYAYLGRRLGPAGFGEWRVVLSVLVWFEILVNSGLVKVATQRLTEKPSDRPRIARAAYAGQLAIAGGAFVALIALAGPIATLLGNPDLATYLRISALDIPAYALLMIASSLLLGEHRYERQALAWTVYATAKLVAIGAMVALGFSVAGALVGNALSSLAGLAVAFAPLGTRDADDGGVVPLAKSMAFAAVPFLTLSLVEGVGRSADLWMVQALVPVAVAVGWYASASVLADVPTFLFEGLNRVLFPSISSARADGEHRLMARYALQGMRLAIVVAVFGIAVAASTGKQVLTLLYSAAFAGAFVPLVVLMVGSLGKTVRATAAEVLLAREQRGLANVILVVAVAAQVALLWWLVGPYGLTGAAIAVAVSSLGAALWSGIAIRDLVGAHPLLTLVRASIAAAIVGGVLWWVSPSPVGLFIAYPLAAVAYVALLWVVREIGSDEVASVRAAIGR